MKHFAIIADSSSSEGMALAAMVFFGLAGLGLLLGLVNVFNLSKQKKIPMKQMRDISPGPVRVKGKVATLSPLLNAPMTNSPCIFYSVAFLSNKRQGHLTYQDTQSAVFSISDGTGEVLFDVQASFEGRGRNTAGGWVNTKRFSTLTGLAANIPAEYRKATPSSSWIIEHFLPSVQDVVITGEARENLDPATRDRARWVLTGFITSKSEQEIFAKVKWIIGICLGGAVVFGAIGLVLILASMPNL